jgi:hypothetical protein
MKARTQRQPQPFLNELLDHRLVSYAAAAAGAGLLGLAQPAEAQIVYTPAHVVIGFRGSYGLDLTNDGTINFTLRNDVELTTSTLFSTLLALPEPGNAVEGVRFRSHDFAYALKLGGSIGSKQNFVRTYPVMGLVIGPPAGPQYSGSWIHVSNRYLGLRFQINGETHFGWARMSVQLSVNHRVEALLTGYAYQRQPNTPILAGQEQGSELRPAQEPGTEGTNHPAAFSAQPASLGLLALGAEALPLWRREKGPQQ